MKQDLPDVLDVVFVTLRKYSNIIEIYKHTMVQHLPQDIIDEGLEDVWGVS